jgi:hypothetical protein
MRLRFKKFRRFIIKNSLCERVDAVFAGEQRQFRFLVLLAVIMPQAAAG